MSKINILGLGGLDEKNKNLYILEIDSKIFILDAGIFEPLKDEFGIQYVIPKLSYLKENVDKIKGIFLSSANNQQIGAIGQIVREIPNISIYASDVVIEFIKINYKNVDKWKLNLIESLKTFECGGIKITPFAITSSIPGTLNYIFSTQDGNIVYLTDYVFDQIEWFNKSTPLKQLNNLFNEQTLLLMSDSLNSSIESNNVMHYKIKSFIENKLFENNTRVIATLYEDEIMNIMELIMYAKEKKRAIYFYDQHQYLLMQYLKKTNYINDYYFASYEDTIKNQTPIDNKNALIIVTGSRTNLYTRLENLILSEEGLMIEESDLVFLGAPYQPGNEHIYAGIINELSRINPTILEIPTGQKISIHPTQFDLKNFLMLAKPKYFMPIKGYYKEMLSGSKVAKSLNMADNQIIMADNGEVFTIENKISQGKTRKLKDIGIFNIQLVDDSGIETEIISDRTLLASDGVVTIGLMIDKATKEIKSNIDIQMKGFIFLKGHEKELEELTKIITDTIKNSKEDWILSRVESKISKEITKKLKASFKKTPYIFLQIYEV